MERKEAIAKAREGENLRLMARYNENESIDSIRDIVNKAEKFFQEATQLDETYTWAWAHWGATLSYHGGILDQSSNDKLNFYQEADEKFDRATNKDQGGNPNYAWAWAHRGENSCWWAMLLLSARENGEEGRQALNNAKNHLTKAINLDTEYTWAYARLGVVYRIFGKLEKEDLGDSKGTQPNFDLAVDNFSKAIKLNENYSWAYAYRGVVHRQKARGLEASGLKTEALEQWKLTYKDIEYSLREYLNVFERPKLLTLPYLYPVPRRSFIVESFNESPFKDYAKLVFRFYEEGYDAVGEEEIGQVLAAIAKEWASIGQ